jgi:predicted RNA-binding protein YlxR (DUF448 family)
MGRRTDHVPERTCIATRETHPRAALLRFVLSPEGEVVFDLKGDLPGRGAWVKPERAALAEAIRRRAFSRAFKAAARVPEDLPEQVIARLKEAAIDTLSLARKAGQAVAGFDKVREALRNGDVAVIVEAVDGAADGRSKILALARATSAGATLVEMLDSRELGLAFGRERGIHAAMKPGGLARKFTDLAGKLAGLVDGRVVPVTACQEEWNRTDDE